MTKADLPELAGLQPPDWPDVIAQFEQYLSWPAARPVKLSQDQSIAAIGCAILHGDTAWLGHIIVRQALRRQGLGTRITQVLLDLPEVGKCRTVSLVATPAGEPLYARLGFVRESTYLFFKGGRTPRIPTDVQIVSFRPTMLPEVLQLDLRASGEDRSAMLQHHLNKAMVALEDGKMTGFLLPNLGEGLIVAGTQNAGLALAKLRLQNAAVSVVPDRNRVAINMLTMQGFSHYRTGVRMYLGEMLDFHPGMIYNRIGGNLG
jgi:GNAT superfamily N-acetyltransferase